jgi:Na+-transporting NADH:ubiquinone oxidoreductase subunit C
MSKDNKLYIFGVAMALCLACSVVVSGAAVTLRPMQQANRVLDQRTNVLRVVGLYERGMDVDAVFEERIETRVISFEDGRFVDHIDPNTYDQQRAARDPATNITLSSSEDIASIGAKPKFGLVYLVRGEDGGIQNYVLPVHGYGLWSTMWGYLALEGDANTIAGITFYDHGETPGLGGEIDNPRWRAQWEGKRVFDEAGAPAFTVVKGSVDTSSDMAQYRVDGLSGATLTSNGVTNMMRFWMSERGYKPFLEQVAGG